ncbi:hypothetical protein [Streptomyces sp. NPDC005336]|uniref:hypothetical protein n=1 Tax=unclassified Streptomyces TaxID=2593676 RepID=UPI0033BB1846
MSMAVPALYAAVIWGTAVVASLVGNPKNWSGGFLAFAWIISAVHAAILDAEWKRD